MPELDIFNDDAFSMASLTGAVNKVPYRPGQISAAGIFDEDGVTTTTVWIEEQNGILGLVEPSERGGPGETTGSEKRNGIPFAVPHYQRDDSVKADEVQNVRAFGEENELETVLGRVNKKTARHGQDLSMTLEHQRVGGIKGVVTSKSGNVIENLYTRFGIAVPAPVSLELDVEATDAGKLVQDVVYSIEDDLDEHYGGIHAFTGRDFHNALWRHKSVKETLLSHAGAVEMRMATPNVFEFGDVIWERYRTGAKATADLGAPYIAADEARVVPTGVDGLFLTRFAPADYEETVNTLGVPFYANQWEMPNGKGRNIEVQMNAISICTRPGALRRLTLT